MQTSPWLLLFLGSCTARHPAAATWESPHRQDHPLAGQIIEVSTQRVLSERALVARLRSVPVVLLGEKHDNPDHHRLQGRLVAALATADHAVALEMLDADDPVAVEGPDDVEALAARVGWATSGWPDVALYRPILEATFAAEATILAANPPRAVVRAVAMGRGETAMIPEGVQARQTPLPEAAQRGLLAELEAAHCGMMSVPAVLSRLAEAQILKDAWMAQVLDGWAGPAILIAGAGHTRTDRGVPTRLERPSLTVQFVEVGANTSVVAEVEERVTADFLWFTPVVELRDPCDAFRESLEREDAAPAGESGD